MRYDTTPTLETYEQLIDFIHQQSAFVSQVTLYTYIKTRAGTQFPKLFENEQYLASLKIARWHIFAACVADLSIFAAAQFYKSGAMTTKQTAEIAEKLISALLSDVEQDDVDNAIFDAAIKNSKTRCKKMDFEQASTGDHAFQTSAQALLDWAPVVDEFKKNDEPIVRNSIHLRWISVRRDLVKGLNIERILPELS